MQIILEQKVKKSSFDVARQIINLHKQGEQFNIRDLTKKAGSLEIFMKKA